MKLNLDEAAEKSIRDLMAFTGETTPGEALGVALGVALWVYGEQAAGRRLAVIDEDGKGYTPYTLKRKS